LHITSQTRSQIQCDLLFSLRIALQPQRLLYHHSRKLLLSEKGYHDATCIGHLTTQDLMISSKLPRQAAPKPLPRRHRNNEIGVPNTTGEPGCTSGMAIPAKIPQTVWHARVMFRALALCYTPGSLMHACDEAWSELRRVAKRGVPNLCPRIARDVCVEAHRSCV
jgi:hypothetical protein